MVASQKILRFWSEDDPDYGLTETMEGRRNARPTLYVKVTLFQSFTIPNSATCWTVGALAYVTESLANLCSGLRT